MENYLIVGNYFAIDINGNKKITTLKAKQWIEEECLLCGSSLEGRRAAFTYLSGYRYKLPIVLDDNASNIYFLNYALNNRDCQLVNFSKLIAYYALNSYTTKLLFEGGISQEIAVNIRCFKRQEKLLKLFRQKRYKKLYNTLNE